MVLLYRFRLLKLLSSDIRNQDLEFVMLLLANYCSRTFCEQEFDRSKILFNEQVKCFDPEPE